MTIKRDVGAGYIVSISFWIENKHFLILIQYSHSKFNLKKLSQNYTSTRKILLQDTLPYSFTLTSSATASEIILFISIISCQEEIQSHLFRDVAELHNLSTTLSAVSNTFKAPDVLGLFLFNNQFFHICKTRLVRF